MIKVITIEREYGSGAAEIAKEIAKRLGWPLWDHEITAEIARRLHCDVRAVEEREERPDTAFYRLAKIFMRGSYEESYTGGGLELLDAEHLAELFQRVIADIAKSGKCVIVGRAAPWFLRERDDTLRVFIHATYEEKMRRLTAQGISEEEANRLIETVDRERGAFVRKYYGKTWPQRDVYHLMISSNDGNEFVVQMIFKAIELLNEAMPGEQENIKNIEDAQEHPGIHV